MAMRFVRIPTGEVGYAYQRDIWMGSVFGSVEKSEIVVEYVSLESGARRKAFFDINAKDIEFVEEKDFLEFIKSDECIAARKRLSKNRAGRRKLNSKRDEQIYKLRQTGLTYEDIAREYGLSRERIRQICEKAERSALWEYSHILSAGGETNEAG